MTVQLVRGDAAHLPLADGSVDLIVTSPPYFALRSYQDNGAHYAGQIGSEATPAEFVDALIACTAEWVRVLKPAGSLWVNLGDKYAGAPSGTDSRGHDGYTRDREHGTYRTRGRWVASVPSKSLMGLPWRYALRCIDDLGLILRAEVVWSKPNGLPESVTDRVRRSHEQWFHLTRQPRYYAAVDTIREPGTGRIGLTYEERQRSGARTYGDFNAHTSGGPGMATNPLGKLPGSVWTIPSQPLTVPAELGVDHFAAFPMEWPRRIILGWSPSGICTRCGEGRRPVSSKGEPVLRAWSARGAQYTGSTENGGHHGENSSTLKHMVPVTVTGECCACPDTTAPTRPAIVLDPFGGTGTTALIADVLGRHGISVDMSADYCRLAKWRTTDPGQRAAAMQVEKPEAVADGQMQLFA